MDKYKPDLSAAKAATIGAIVGFGSTATGNPTIPMLAVGAAAGIGQAVANRKAAKKHAANAMEAHRALNRIQFKKQANWANDLDDGPVEEITAYPAETIKRPKDPYS